MIRNQIVKQLKREEVRMLDLYDICLIFVLGYSLFGWLIVFDIKINYGRLKNSVTKIQFPPKISWFLFEVPNLIWVFYFLFVKGDPLSFGYALFIIHYINRDILYPLRMKTTTKVPLEIILAASSFTFANGYLQSLANMKNQANIMMKGIGCFLFFLGMYINIKSDNILQEAKQKSAHMASGKKYVLINEFLFKYVANPNYFGEVIQWFGYFVACGGTFEAGLFVFSTFNILTAAAIPRNKWNKKNIEGYPKDRKSIIPYLI